MSTPSTATITVPPNHHYYPHQQQYLPPMADYHHNAAYGSGSGSASGTGTGSGSSRNYSSGYVNNTTPADHRRPAASTVRQPQTQTQTQSQVHPAAYNYEPTAPPSSNGSARKRTREEPVDWERYFGGKPPKEIIVIDDDEPSHASHPPAIQPSTQPAAAASSHAAYNSTSVNGSSQYHTDKRRKMTSSTTAAYDPVYNAHNQQQLSYSNTQTPTYYDASPRPYTGSTDRTASYNTTTAATSLSSNGTYLEDGTVGQKRKRSTRQAAADQKKREVATRSDPFSEYVPPPKPPLKAKDVYVPVVHDRVSAKDVNVDDDDGHYIVKDNTELTERYSVIRLLGQGTFGKVVQAWDRKRQTEVAVKIIRSVQKYRDASRIELRVLSTLAQNDKQNRNKCIHLRDTFDFRSHICIVTDLLGQSVFDFLKSNQFVPFPSTHIQKFARQLFTSVAFLHDLNLIHTDLKPENILLVDSQYQTFTYNRNIPSSSTTTARSAKFRRVLLDPEIRLIDFGSATFDDEYHSSVVSTRHYRAPEIILNLGWSFPCDIWSIGCILVEFFTGDALFQTHDNLEHLAMMEAICDAQLDKPLIRQVTSARGSNKNAAAQYFKRQTLDYPQQDTPRSSKKFVKAMKKLPVRPPPKFSVYNNYPEPPLPYDLQQNVQPPKPELVRNPYTRYLYPIQETIPTHTTFNKQFLDLLQQIFVYDPKKRITAHQALKHPWFGETLEDDGTEAEKIRFERERLERAKQRTQAAPR